jgi:hypothetical protein
MLWKRQPGESDTDFIAFACYLRLKGRRSLTAVATRTNQRLGTIRRLSAKHNWRRRVTAFEAALAQATAEALSDSLFKQPATRRGALDDFRLREFHFAKQVLDAAHVWLKRASDPRRRTLSLNHIIHLLELSFKLRSLACGLPYGNRPPRRKRPEDQPGYWTAPSEEEALARMFGPRPGGT